MERYVYWVSPTLCHSMTLSFIGEPLRSEYLGYVSATTGCNTNHHLIIPEQRALHIHTFTGEEVGRLDADDLGIEEGFGISGVGYSEDGILTLLVTDGGLFDSGNKRAIAVRISY